MNPACGHRRGTCGLGRSMGWRRLGGAWPEACEGLTAKDSRTRNACGGMEPKRYKTGEQVGGKRAARGEKRAGRDERRGKAKPVKGRRAGGRAGVVKSVSHALERTGDKWYNNA